MNAPQPGTPLPWVAHSAFYPHGTKGDIYAKDARDVRDCTPICRVVRPQSKRAYDTQKPPIDALHSIAERKQSTPIIEANAAYIVHAANNYPKAQALADALRRISTLRPAGDVATAKNTRQLVQQMEAIALSALAAWDAKP